jgi:glycosyltransferase involved in cell wall biosynthesis
VATELVFTATYCEQENIEAWVRGVHAYRPDADILVVDDSSPDDTGAILQRLQGEIPRLQVHTRPGKLGLSSAHLYAIDRGLGGGYDRLVTMDADGSHQPSQIPGLVEASADADFIIGTRYRGGSHQAAHFRRFLSLGANKAARRLLPMGLSEYTTSFRVFTPTALTSLADATFECGGYAFFIECLEVMHSDGLVLAEAPIDFLDRAGGRSKIPRAQILLSAKALLHLSRQRRRTPAIASLCGD